MSLEPIKEIPDFDHDVDPMILAKLNDAERYMVTNMSKMRQENRWLKERLVESYNVVVEHQKFHTRYASPIGLFFGFIGVVVVAVIGAVAQAFFTSPK